ncbi:hypothetical protein DNG35_01225 [Mesonia sp. K7]|nr:hypothetical protein DNG35_01225 [Mesonia sp. K7]
MDIFFVALNAPENSNRNAHWFSNNLSFWNVLYRSGIITQPIKNKLEGDIKVFGSNSINHLNWTIGVTDLNRRDVQTDSTYVSVNTNDIQRILNILEVSSVKRLCLVHSKVGEAFRRYAKDAIFNKNRYGKIGVYKKTEIFEVPFHNSSVKQKERYYNLLIQ